VVCVGRKHSWLLPTPQPIFQKFISNPRRLLQEHKTVYFGNVKHTAGNCWDLRKRIGKLAGGWNSYVHTDYCSKAFGLRLSLTLKEEQ
jgi:hypothetical protein